ncbi:MAG: hypothetical protein QG574_4919 [Cyanobacteriota bacterium erpe_2018_sw_21hr_WHONDRS-SW48-000092_B_bin.40]|jgi:hypothetical protein|nr:hypothetical protein [Cyanobacteriota bacterium erpe_2018_sw_21hr_WHONDRS-SW48-000092_B_bin.40]
MKFMGLFTLDAQKIKELLDETERQYEDCLARGLVKEAKSWKMFLDHSELLFPVGVDWCEVRLLRVRGKLNRSRFRTDPAVLLERKKLEEQLRELEKARGLDRNVGVLARCLLLGLTTFGTLFAGFEGLLFESEVILSVTACWSLVLFLCWIYRDESSKT